MRNKRLYLILAVIVAILLVPFFAMQFTSEVNWDGKDFIAMGLLLLITGLICELILRKVKSAKGRLLFCGAILLVFVLIWVELAVGIFGTPFAGS